MAMVLNILFVIMWYVVIIKTEGFCIWLLEIVYIYDTFTS